MYIYQVILYYTIFLFGAKGHHCKISTGIHSNIFDISPLHHTSQYFLDFCLQYVYFFKVYLRPHFGHIYTVACLFSSALMPFSTNIHFCIYMYMHTYAQLLIALCAMTFYCSATFMQFHSFHF